MPRPECKPEEDPRIPLGCNGRFLWVLSAVSSRDRRVDGSWVEVREKRFLARTGECAAQEDSDFVGLTEAGLDQTGYIALTVP